MLGTLECGCGVEGSFHQLIVSVVFGDSMIDDFELSIDQPVPFEQFESLHVEKEGFEVIVEQGLVPRSLEGEGVPVQAEGLLELSDPLPIPMHRLGHNRVPLRAITK